MKDLILSLDQGTTSSRAILFDHAGQIYDSAQQEFKQYFPKPGWVEHDPMDIWTSQYDCAKRMMQKASVDNRAVIALGITNQRETTLVWERNTGKPIMNAIVWQDRRTADYCRELNASEWGAKIRKKTGLVVDAYFSGTKVKWILDHVDGARASAERGELAFGTVDAWLVWQLTEGRVHVTDVSNASRTLLYNIHTLEWDEELLDLFGIPASMLPEVRSSSEVYGQTDLFGASLPVAGIAGDQQAALFGQMCVDKGMVKNTYGTGCFILTVTGQSPVVSENNLLTTIAWQLDGKTIYALEGAVFVGGAVVQWLRDEMGIIENSSDVEALASDVPDNGGVYFVPAFVGLGAPHWDAYARGSIMGLTRGSNRSHIARAALEAICFQSREVIQAMSTDSGLAIKEVRVDGGATANDLLMQIQSDSLSIDVVRPKVLETTALGAAYFAGLAVGYWENIADLKKQWTVDEVFKPSTSMEIEYKEWSKAVDRSKNWLD